MQYKKEGGDQSTMGGILTTVITSLSVGAVTALVTWLFKQIKKYKNLADKEEDELLKKTINNALTEQLEPIRKDIIELKKTETNFTTRLKPTQEEIEHLKDDISEILDALKKQGIDLQNIKDREDYLEAETRSAWKYRIRQLCHIYMARGWMTVDEYNQLQEMFNLYTAIGGNGQTKELYEKTMNTVPVKTENEVREILSQK